MEHEAFNPVVCDLDGTLVDSGPAIIATVRLACAEVGAPVAEDRDLGFCVGPPLEETLPMLVGDTELAGRAAEAYRALHPAVLSEGSSPAHPGAREALASFAGAGISVAVATYKLTSLATATLEAGRLAGLVDIVVGRASPHDRRSKADLIVEALRLLAPHRSKPVYIGDHADDEIAAAAAGVTYLRFGPLTWGDLELRVLSGESGQ
ncbi:MAG TPA: HAD hydrolase-like protein [Actinomycetota bacterium]